MRHVVADQDDGDAAGLHVEDEFEHAAGFLDAEGGGRLVEDDDLGAEGGGAGDGDALALAAGEGFHRLVDVLDRHQPEIGEFLAGDALHLGMVELAEDLAEQARLAQFAAHEHVVGDRQAGRHRERLVDGLDAGGAGGDRRGEAHRPTLELDLALVDLDGAGERLDQRGLAGAVVADDGEDLAGMKVEIAMVERRDPAIPLDEATRLENGFHHTAAFLIHWSTATATMISAPIIR